MPIKPSKPFNITPANISKSPFFSIGAYGSTDEPFAKSFLSQARDYHENGDKWDDSKLQKFFVDGFLAGCIYRFTGYREDNKEMDYSMRVDEKSSTQPVYYSFLEARSNIALKVNFELDDKSQNKIAESLVKQIQSDKQLLSLGVSFQREKVQLEKKHVLKNTLPDGDEKKRLVASIIEDEKNLSGLQCDIVNHVAKLIVNLEKNIKPDEILKECDIIDQKDEKHKDVSSSSPSVESKAALVAIKLSNFALEPEPEPEPEPNQLHAKWRCIKKKISDLAEHVKNSDVAISANMRKLNQVVAEQGAPELEQNIRSTLDGLVKTRNDLSENIGRKALVEINKMQKLLTEELKSTNQEKLATVSELLEKFTILEQLVKSGVQDHKNWQSWVLHLNSQLDSTCLQIDSALQVNSKNDEHQIDTVPTNKF